MPDAADLAQQLAAEDRAKQRQYVLSSTRGRWRVLGLGAVLLAAVRVAGLVPIAWSFVLGFTVLFAAVNYAMARVARDRKSTRLNSSHLVISYAVFCLKKKN